MIHRSGLTSSANREANQAVQRTGASRFAQRQMTHQWRLAPVADLRVRRKHMRISPHLCFNGQCRAAFTAYQRILGGTLATMLTYGESPMANQVDSRWHDRIVH